MKYIRILFTIISVLYLLPSNTFTLAQVGRRISKGLVPSKKISKNLTRRSTSLKMLRKIFSPKRFWRFFSTSFTLFKQQFPIPFKRETALFSTHVDLKSMLIGHLDRENEKVSVAIYYLTDKDIAHALVRAHQRGVDVEIVADKKASQNRYSQIPFLIASGISVFLYSCAKCAWSIMHHKFALFFGQKMVWNGSFILPKQQGCLIEKMWF